MAASPTPRPTPTDPLARALAAWQGAAAWAAPSPIAIAFSGGADSTALLHAGAQLWPGRVRALHVHHGLQAAADDFERHVRDVCERSRVPVHVARVDARHMPGESPEDAARRARYAALAALAGEAGCGHVLLGQHADDQVETVLLALSRGAGLPGLAGMAASFERAGVRFHRPLLDIAGAELRAWLAAEGFDWIDDPSNADTGFTRNRIRAQLLPALEAAFPQFRATFARSARHAAQAQRMLDDIADEDLRALGDEPTLAGWQALAPDRQANALRRWLVTRHGTAASEAQLAQLQSQIAACTTRGHRIEMRVGAGTVSRQGDRLAWVQSPGFA